MYNSLSCGIELNRSPNYIKTASILYLFAFLMLMASSLLLFLKLILTCLIILQMLYILKSPYPSGKISIQFIYDEWILNKNGQRIIFTRRRVLLNTGLFFLLELSSPDQRKIIAIFLDQLSHTEFRSIVLGLNVNEL